MAIAVCAIGLLLTLASWQWSRNRVREHAEGLFERQVALVSMAIRERVIDYETVLRSTSAFFAGSEKIERREWQRFVQELNLDRVYPGLLSVGFARSVTASEAPKFVAEIRKEGVPDFSIHPEGLRDQFLAVVFNEPVHPWPHNLLGHDLLADTHQREAVVKALELGGAALTVGMSVTPDGKGKDRPWLMMVYPLYRTPAAGTTFHHRMRELVGVSFVPFYVEDFMDGLLPSSVSGIEVRVIEGDDSGEGTVLFEANGRKRVASRVPDPPIFRSEAFDFGGRLWTVQFLATSGFEGLVNPVEPLAFLLGGLLTTGLLCWVLWMESRTHLRASRLASRMTGELRALSAHVLSLQDEERGRIARDLHDSTVQTLGLASRNLSAVQDSPTADPRTRESLTDSVMLVDTAVQDLRTLSYLLHPPTLDLLGLPGALKDFVSGFSKRSGIAVQFSAPAEFGRFSPEMETALFRVTQEALANINRHANSATAQVRLERVADAVLVTVVDDGVGIPPDMLAKINHEEAHLGVGIAGMRERLRQLGGSLVIQRRARGTLVRASLPIHQMP